MRIIAAVIVLLPSLANAQMIIEKNALIGCEEDYCTVIGVQSIQAIEFTPKNGMIAAYRVVRIVGEKRDIDRNAFEKKAEHLPTG